MEADALYFLKLNLSKFKLAFSTFIYVVSRSILNIGRM